MIRLNQMLLVAYIFVVYGESCINYNIAVRVTRELGRHCTVVLSLTLLNHNDLTTMTETTLI